MDFNKRRETTFYHLLGNKPELDRPSKIKGAYPNQQRETRMSDLGLQPREVWKQSNRLPAEERLGSSKNNRAFCGRHTWPLEFKKF
jgi:hypothetical protein